MSTKPTATTGWTGGTTIEPPAGKKILGWLNDERPPAQYMQWLFERIELWLQYLADAAYTGAVSFAGDVTFSAAIKHGDRVKSISPLVFVADANWTDGGTVFFGDSGYIKSVGAGRVVFPIPAVEGERLKSLVFARFGDGAADFTALVVYKLTAAGAVSDITAAATSDTNPAAAWADKTVDVTDTVVAAGDTFWFHATSNAAGLRIGSIRVTYDRP